MVLVSKSVNSESPLATQINQIKMILHREAADVRYFENIKYLQSHGYSDIKKASEILPKILNREFVWYAPKISSISIFDGDDLLLNQRGVNNFDIFSIYLPKYFELVKISELLAGGMTYEDISNNKKQVNKQCKDFKIGETPKAIKLWRNKVAAHFSIADQYEDDNLATIISSTHSFPIFQTPYYYVGATQLGFGDQQSALEPWSLTKEYDELAAKWWPEYKLAPLVMSFNGGWSD